MKKQLFSSSKEIYKGNLHCHTTYSDGRHTPEEIKAMYKERGYSVVAFTEHEVMHSQSHLSGEDFLAINSYEVALRKKMPKDTPSHTIPVYHFNLYATRPDLLQPQLPDIDYEDINAINKCISDVTKAGFLVCYNHPYWSLQTYEDYGKLKGCFAMEIYNHNCELEIRSTGEHSQVYDEMLRAGHYLNCVATDDNHNSPSLHLPDKDSFGGFVYIASESLAYEDIMKSLAEGEFYSSQGPKIHEISLTGNSLQVKCSPVQRVNVYTGGRKTFEKEGVGLTEALFELKGDEVYVRVVCCDESSKLAYSNAYKL